MLEYKNMNTFSTVMEHIKDQKLYIILLPTNYLFKHFFPKFFNLHLNLDTMARNMNMDSLERNVDSC